MAPFPASIAAFGKPGGGDWAEGDRLIQGDLAKTLRAIGDGGADAFYKGWIADRIAEDMRAHGGIITRSDFAAYKVRELAPIRGTYKGYDIVSMPPPSSGGVALVEMLNILEPFDLKAKGLLTAPALHLQIEAMRRAYLDRARYLGDPDFADVPVARLTSKEHARESGGLDRSLEGIEQRRARCGHRHGSGRRGGRDDALLRHRSKRPCRDEHVHARRRLRLARRRQGDGLPPQQRDGGLQQEARRNQRDRRHRHAGQRDRARQDDAELA